MPTAVISDVLGNAEALKRVLDDIAVRKIDRIVCLGNIIGSGPEPLACVDLIHRTCSRCLMGDCEFGALYEPSGHSPGAAAAAHRNRTLLEADPDLVQRRNRLEFLGKLPIHAVESLPEMGFAVLFSHGSPIGPVGGYLFPDDAISAPAKMAAAFARVDRLAMIGHTRLPGVFTDEPEFYPPSELSEGGTYYLDTRRKAIVSVASVGQSQDSDPRPGYTVLHPDRVEFVRVPVDGTGGGGSPGRRTPPPAPGDRPARAASANSNSADQPRSKLAD